MCRNIRTLHNFAPPATEDEVRAAALQYVRKVSGSAKPSAANLAAFERAVDQVASATSAAAGGAGHLRPAQGPRGRGRQAPGAGRQALRGVRPAVKTRKLRGEHVFGRRDT
ncbi:MAG: DUF2277 domain-containing protein [Thermoleophilaceae bacterium]